MPSARARSLLALAAAALFLIWQLVHSAHAHVLFGDFRAFYCAAGAVAHGENPYYGSSLYACQRAPMPLGLYRVVPGLTLPAPLPGYALLAFVPLAQLPYPAACAAWLLVMLLCIAFSIRALSQLLDRPAELAVWALVPGFAIVVVPFGELGCVLVAALLWMALALRKQAWWSAALAGGVAMIEPHVGLPAMLAAFVFVPAMRARIAAVAAALLLLDFAGSAGAALTYFSTVLPAHARAEVSSSVQYGLTWMLHAAHAGNALALAGGSVDYVLMLVLGVLASRAADSALEDRASYALVAPAFAVFGGSFVHYVQIMAAIPAALLLATRGPQAWRPLFRAAALLLIVPWLWVLAQPVLVPVFAGVCAWCAFALDLAPRYALRAALAVALLAGAVLVTGAHFGAGATSAFHARPIQGALAQNAWGRYVRAQRSGSGVAWWIAKAPTWMGLLLFSFGALALEADRRSRRQPPEAAIAAIR